MICRLLSNLCASFQHTFLSDLQHSTVPRYDHGCLSFKFSITPQPQPFPWLQLPQILPGLMNLYFSATPMWSTGFTQLLKLGSDSLLINKCNYIGLEGQSPTLPGIQRSLIVMIFQPKRQKHITQVIWEHGNREI